LIETFPSQPYFLTMPKMSSVSLTNEDDEIFDTTLFFVGPSSISSEADTPISSASDESHGDVRSMEETRSSHSELMKYVAIGALRVHEEQHGLSNHKWIGTYDEDTVRPFLKKRWLVFEHVNHQSHEGKASLRVYALPEDQ
jgi:hypothetical protein